ncbi:TraM recognition domain-containing protein [Heliobacterium undosum]|uniref:TraM recognition domain-containing protein n=1 Tax=Heliomicrobium undosum TaxID=121734 RepID=A0A845L3I0_9FIRM|nr:TraM recognition domain-containing protein [Heliomicrobium undosum]MZP31187.1 TraM recognition domain-containing protein [Heliomicrobium undosum]
MNNAAIGMILISSGGYAAGVFFPEQNRMLFPLILLVLAAGGYLANRKKNDQTARLFGVATVVNITWLASTYAQGLTLPMAERLAAIPSLSGWARRIPVIAALAPPLLLSTGITLVFVRQSQGEKMQARMRQITDAARQQGWIATLLSLGKTNTIIDLSYMDVEICKDVDTNEPVALTGKDRFLHTGIFGPTGCGKTSSIIKPMAYQDLQRIADGHKLGLTFIEPSGDLAEWVAEKCDKLNIPCVHVDPERPDTKKFNTMQGKDNDVAEATRAVLKSMFGKQEAFFATVQETMARNTVLLLKRIHGDHIDFTTVMRILRNTNELQQSVSLYKRIRGNDDLAEYFDAEVFGSMQDKLYQFAAGLRQQMADIGTNELLQRVMNGPSDIILDDHLERGGQVLAVNTAMGPLGKLGDVFGQFVMMHMQNAVFRRDGDEWTRTPHVLYVDEFPRYINPDFDRFLTLARKYRCAAVLALQNSSQLLKADSREFRETVLANTRNKIWFGGLPESDAKWVERECGMVEVIDTKKSFDHHPILPSVFPERVQESAKLEPRFHYTKVMELDSFHIIHKRIQNGRPMAPGEGVCSFIRENDKKKPVSPIRDALNRFRALEERMEAYTAQGGSQEEALDLLQETARLKGEVFRLDSMVREKNRWPWEKAASRVMEDIVRRAIDQLERWEQVLAMPAEPGEEKHEEVTTSEKEVAMASEAIIPEAQPIVFLDDDLAVGGPTSNTQPVPVVSSEAPAAPVPPIEPQKENVPQQKSTGAMPPVDVSQLKVGKRIPGWTCPLCGRSLILRNSKHGLFAGCSGFIETGCAGKTKLPKEMLEEIRRLQAAQTEGR